MTAAVDRSAPVAEILGELEDFTPTDIASAL
jgi:hypothetical protein